MAPPSQGYTDAVGPFEAKVNISPVEPPHRKGRRPKFAWNKLVKQIWWVGETRGLKKTGRRELHCGVAKSVIPRRKSNDGYSLVTAFADVGRYSKPPPSPNRSVETHHHYWLFIPVHRWACMPGSETALEEPMCLGGLIHEGVVAKIVDDPYCGVESPEEILHNWKRVLQALSKCILGWIWNSGTLQASQHRIATLASFSKPETVGRLKSFIGAYKVLLALLDTVVVGRLYYERIN